MTNAILGILSEYGWFVGVFLLAIILLIKFVYSNYSKWSNSKTNVSDDENTELSLTTEQVLKHHTFFTNAQYRFAVEIPNLEFVPLKPVRDKVFKDLLQISFKVVYDVAKGFTDFDDMNEWDSEKWVGVMQQAINRIHIDTENKARQEGIPEIVLRKFLKWHVESINALDEYILVLGNSKFYKSNLAKTNTLLLLMNLLLVTILGDAERVLRDLNGEIKGLNYKGSIID